MNNNTISVVFADSSHAHYAPRICELIYESALQRGTGIAKRSPEYIAAKMTGGKAVVALDGEKLVGFSYIECWGHGDFVATSGLIVDPEYRHMGLAEQIKRRTFELARRRFPFAKLFSITTSLPVTLRCDERSIASMSRITGSRYCASWRNMPYHVATCSFQ
jgi:GNAT superfamily N-acetyltransferase